MKFMLTGGVNALLLFHENFLLQYVSFVTAVLHKVFQKYGNGNLVNTSGNWCFCPEKSW